MRRMDKSTNGIAAIVEIFAYAATALRSIVTNNKIQIDEDTGFVPPNFVCRSRQTPPIPSRRTPQG